MLVVVVVGVVVVVVGVVVVVKGGRGGEYDGLRWAWR